MPTVFCLLCLLSRSHFTFYFFFNATPTTEIYTLSLHDALPIFPASSNGSSAPTATSPPTSRYRRPARTTMTFTRSEEHTSELQSRQYLVCRLLLEKKKKKNTRINNQTTNTAISTIKTATTVKDQ